MDTVSQQKRSEVMSRVRGKNTKPELFVRHLIYRMGFRYRLHIQSLPGRPDIVFSRRKKIILVHGCFWHGHSGCPNYRLPSSRQDYWIPKIQGNILRDSENERKLKDQGWKVLVIWECEVKKDGERLSDKIHRFLESA